jgi:thiamine biosynthesis protein ThiI
MKLVSLISTGIDSPVATYLISKYSKEIILVHGDIKPFTDNQEIKNFLILAKYLKKISKAKISIYIVPHGFSLLNYKLTCNNRYTCIFCKRMLLRYAEKIAENTSAGAIIMGDSLGQVASQTLKNIKTIEESIKTPILRPLIGLDKNEIVKIAKEIGTYDISILPTTSCKAVPDKPVTQCKLEKILLEEMKIDYTNLVIEAVKKSQLFLFK